MNEEQKEFPMEFDHTQAYDSENGEIGKRLQEIFEIGREHGCPMIFIATESIEDGTASMTSKISSRNDMIPDQMVMALKMLELPSEQFDIIVQLVDIFQYANKNIEMVRADVNNAVQRVIENAN